MTAQNSHSVVSDEGHDLHRYSGTLKALIVEDSEGIRETTKELLEEYFASVDTADNGEAGLARYRDVRHDIVIADINMPVMNGIEMARLIRQINPGQIVIFISGYNDSDSLIKIINMGIDHFLMKPFMKADLYRILGKALKYRWMHNLEKEYQKQLEDAVTIQTRELREALRMVKDLSDELVLRLSAAAEHHDAETGNHIKRIGLYAEFLAGELGMGREFRELIKFSAPLHDIGKIGIPDHLLIKPGRLSREEWEVMKRHTVIGANILSGSSIKYIQAGHLIALHHHEKWDGSGYPFGLKGMEISIEGRIIAICDQYDALVSRRPYKEAFTHEKAFTIISEGDGRTMPFHFDPDILEIFRKKSYVFREIHASCGSDS